MKLSFFNQLPSYMTTSTTASLLTPIVSNQCLPRPFLVTFVVTRRCNSHCQMCNIWQEKDSPFLSLKQIQHIFGKGDFSFVRQLTLTGGEPTLRPDLPELFEIIRAACPKLEHVEVATSGLNTQRTLEYIERILEIIKHSPRRINRFVTQVSLDGIGDMHDTIRGIRGFYPRVRKTLDGLGQLEKHYPILRRRLSCVVMPQNISHIKSLLAFAQEQGFPIYFSPVIASGEYYRNVQGSNELLFISGKGGSEEAAKMFGELAVQENSAMQFYYQDVSQMLQGARRSRACMMGFYGCIIEHDGSVYPCVNYETNSFGNLLEQSFEEVWFGPQADTARKELRLKGCPACTSSCYTLPVNAGEMLALVSRRVTRSAKTIIPPTPGK